MYVLVLILPKTPYRTNIIKCTDTVYCILCLAYRDDTKTPVRVLDVGICMQGIHKCEVDGNQLQNLHKNIIQGCDAILA